MRVCSKCRTANDDEAIVCAHCGKSLEQKSSPPDQEVRPQVCAQFRSLGIDAEMGTRGEQEEQVGRGGNLLFPLTLGSIGLIDIGEGPIGWVNLRWARRANSGNLGSSYSSYTCHLDYGVRDLRLRPPGVTITSTLIRKFLGSFGRAIDMKWRDDGRGLAVTDRLNGDSSIKKPIMQSAAPLMTYRNTLFITSHPREGCWVIETESPAKETWAAPSKEFWDCYQRIAKHLIAPTPSDR